MATRPSRSPAPRRIGARAATAWTDTGDRIDLVRRPPRPRPVPLDAQPRGIVIDVHRSVLVVVDLQNDFCHPEGWVGQKGGSLRAPRRVIPVVRRLLPPWRAAGGTVLWLNWGIRADRLELPPQVHFIGRRRPGEAGYGECSPIDRGPSLVPGHWGAQVVDDLAVEPGDVTVHKHRLGGFQDSDLDGVLRGLGATTLLFAGVNTDRCVFATLQEAHFRGYDAVLVEDACGTASPASVEHAIRFLVRQLHGFTVRSDALLAALGDAHAPGRSVPRPRTPRKESP